MLKPLWFSGWAIAAATTAIASTAIPAAAATLFTAELDGLQVVSPDFPDGIPTDASGFATFELNEAQTELTYFIDLDGVNLKPDQSDRTDPSDVTKIHIHVGEFGSNGPHTLNIFGLPREDDTDLIVDSENGVLQGIWDDGDAINPETGELFDPTAGGTTKQLSSFVGELFANGLYLQVHTVEFDSPTVPGELRGQIEAASVPEPSAAVGVILLASGLLASRRRKQH
ncbi:MAG: CHRD domain-containing protein [Cyanobacteria bacterium J06636_16]